MHLKAYFQSERGNATALAESLGIPATYLSQMASGDRAITAERAAAIERITSRQVMRWDCRPDDWHRIWPELIGSDGAPAVPVPHEEVEPARQGA